MEGEEEGGPDPGHVPSFLSFLSVQGQPSFILGVHYSMALGTCLAESERSKLLMIMACGETTILYNLKN